MRRRVRHGGRDERYQHLRVSGHFPPCAAARRRRGAIGSGPGDQRQGGDGEVCPIGCRLRDIAEEWT